LAEDYKIQVNTTLNGQLTNLRANSAEELVELTEGLAANSDRFLDALVQVKQAFLLKDILTAGAINGSGNSGVPSGNSNSRNSTVGVPSCKHGPMNDCRGMKTKAGKPYAADYYCPSDDRDNQCKPVKL